MALQKGPQALDQHRDALQWTIMPFTYNPDTVWNGGFLPSAAERNIFGK